MFIGCPASMRNRIYLNKTVFWDVQIFCSGDRKLDHMHRYKSLISTAVEGSKAVKAVMRMRFLLQVACEKTLRFSDRKIELSTWFGLNNGPNVTGFTSTRSTHYERRQAFICVVNEICIVFIFTSTTVSCVIRCAFSAFNLTSQIKLGFLYFFLSAMS